MKLALTGLLAFLIAAVSAAAEYNVIVAASDTASELKAAAKYVCDAKDARPVLQRAIDEAGRLEVKCILLAGTYVIDSRGERSRRGALCFWNDEQKQKFYMHENPRFRTLEGAIEPIGWYSGARIVMSQRLYDELSDDEEFSFLYCDGGGMFSRAWILRNLVIKLPDNRKPIVVVDGRYSTALKYNDVWVTGCDPRSFNPATCEGMNVPHPRSVGFRGTAGSNIGVLNEWKRLSAMGFGTGFDIGGEHVYCESLEAKNNVYGFAFDCYKGKGGIGASDNEKACGGGFYPIVCVNLLDEHNVHMPRFGNASHDGRSQENWAQSVTIRGMNIQWPNSAPGYPDRRAPDFLKGRHRATEAQPGLWRGSIEYVIDHTTPGGGVNLTDEPFFEDGHGRNVEARSLHQRHVKIQTRGKPGTIPKDFRRSVDRSEQVVEESGLSSGELKLLLDRIERETADRPFVVTRTRWLTAILDKARLAVKSDDVFVDWFQDWKSLEYRRVARVKEFRQHHPELNRPFPGACLDVSHTCPDWESILTLGPKGLAARARARRLTAESDDERLFLDCVAEVYDAMARLCVRWAETAEDAGAKDCAAVLREIAAHPPRTLREALQLMLVYDRCQEAEGECVRSQGLFDRLYITFYRDDLAAGRETPESAKRLVKAVFQKFYEQGHPNGKNFGFGGYDREGKPVWNELTEMAFDLQNEMNVPNPKFTFRYGEKTPEEQLMRVSRNLASGQTSVVFFCEETAKKMFLKQGKTSDDLADAVLIGCYEPAIQGREVISSMSVQLNLAKPLEMVLNGKVPADYPSFESAYFDRLGKMIGMALEDERAYVKNWYDLNPAPLLSGSFRDAVAGARDCHRGSMKYNQSGVMLGGLATVVDSLAAVRWLVDETKTVSLPELAAILRDDWKNHESLRLKARHAPPKWGNNDDRADCLGQKVYAFAAGLINGSDNAHGGTFQAGFWSIDNDVNFGRTTGATPDGRKRGDRLSRNNSATAGCGTEGVSALLLSNAKLDQADSPDGFILDAVYPISAARDSMAEKNLVAFLRVFAARGGQCVHLNCFSPQTLREAQKHPELYRDLQVRVCGWNVRWNELSKADQEYFILTAEAQQ